MNFYIRSDSEPATVGEMRTALLKAVQDGKKIKPEKRDQWIGSLLTLPDDQIRYLYHEFKSELTKGFAPEPEDVTFPDFMNDIKKL